MLKKWNSICEKCNFREIESRLAEIMGLFNSTIPGSVEYIELTKEYTQKTEIISRKEKIESLFQEIELYEEIELTEEEKVEYGEVTNQLSLLLDAWEFELMFNGKYDESDCYITIHAGSGGTEAQDWAQMLSRMYLRWGERNNYKISIIDSLNGDVAGLKSITFSVKGKYAYGKLKGEHGVHRLVRVSPFDAKNRRHTSFAAVEVLPHIDLAQAPPLVWSDIEMQTFRSGGPGGQYQNTTDSGVRLIHIPTGIVVESRQERSQIQNRKTCEEMLAAKLAQAEDEKRRQEVNELKGEQTEAGWGHAIRSYVFMPYQLVKDNRTDYETGKVEAVLDGDLNELIRSYLLSVTEK